MVTQASNLSQPCNIFDSDKVSISWIIIIVISILLVSKLLVFPNSSYCFLVEQMALASTWWRLCFRCAPLLRTWRLLPLINHAYGIDLENYPPHPFLCVRCSNTPAMSFSDQMPVMSLAKPIRAKCLPTPWGPSSWIYSKGPMLWSQPSSRDSAKPPRPAHGPWRWQRQWPPAVPRLRSYRFWNELIRRRSVTRYVNLPMDSPRIHCGGIIDMAAWRQVFSKQRVPIVVHRWTTVL